MYLLEASADGILKNGAGKKGQHHQNSQPQFRRTGSMSIHENKVKQQPKVTTGSHFKPSTTPKLNGKPSQEQGEDKQFFQLFTGNRNTTPLFRFEASISWPIR